MVLRNRQRTCAVDLRLLRRIARTLLTDYFCTEKFELCIHLVGAAEMTRLNEQFLGHQGSTDVITFDHADKSGADYPQHAASGAMRTSRPTLQGEIFISLDNAVVQARQFRTDWQSELVRYLIHGLLHLQGHDDLKPAARRKMKREENRLLREVAKRFALSKLGTRTFKRGTRNSAIRNPQSAI